MKLNLSFTEGFAKLDVIGIPDHSLGHDIDTIGILLSWKLKLIGSSVLEGKKENLDNLLYVIYAYARYSISGYSKSISDKSNSVTISTVRNGHEIRLVSKQKDIEPLVIILDDAELTDLIKCFDQVLDDKRIALKWSLPLINPLTHKELKIKILNLNKILYTFTGSALFLALATLFLLIPTKFSKETPVNVSDDTPSGELLRKDS